MGVELAQYDASRGNSKYQIIQGNDGVTYCTCTGWKMRKNCKHLLDWTLNHGSMASTRVPSSDVEQMLESDGTPKKPVFENDKRMEDALSMAINMLKG